MSKLTTVVLAVVLGAAPALADITGTLGLGSAGFVEMRLTSLNWTPDSAALPVPGPPWNADVNSSTSLSFFGGPLFSQEGVLINEGQAFGTPPPAGAGVYNPFLTFEVHSNLQFFLTGVDAGNSNHNCVGLADGQSCSLLVAGNPSPIVLQKVGTSTNWSINFFGFATDGVSNNQDWTGSFSATIPNTSPLDIEQSLCGIDDVCDAADVAAGRTIDVRSVSGSILATTPTAVPEPGTLPLCVTTSALALFIVRRKRTNTRPSNS